MSGEGYDAGETLADGDVVPLAAVLARRPAASRWAEVTWSVVGVVAGEVAATVGAAPVPVHTAEAESRYLSGGLSLQLHRDDAESYHHNLSTEAPAVFVICRGTDAGVPQPFLATASYAEASAYLEGDAEVYPVPMPPEVYRWVEGFVLHHFVPRERKKRRREDWRQDAGDAGPG